LFTCRFAVSGVVHKVYYDGHDITHLMVGDLNRPGSTNEIAIPVGASGNLAILAMAPSGGSGGLILNGNRLHSAAGGRWKSMGVPSLRDVPPFWYANDYSDSAWDAPSPSANLELSLADRQDSPTGLSSGPDSGDAETIWGSGQQPACSLFRVSVAGAYPYHYKGIMCPDGRERYSYSLILDSKLQREGPVAGLAVYGGRQVVIFGEMKLTPPDSSIHETSTLAPTTEGIFSYIESEESRSMVGHEHDASVDHAPCEIYDELQVGCAGAVMVGAYGDAITSGTLTLELDFSELPTEYDDEADMNHSFSAFEQIVGNLSRDHDGGTSMAAADVATVDALVEVEAGMKKEVKRLRREKEQFQQQSVSLMEKVVELQHRINTSMRSTGSAAGSNQTSPAVWHATFLDGEMGIVVGHGQEDEGQSWGGEEGEEEGEEEDGLLHVMSVVQGTQADRQGIRRGAVVAGVNGIPLAQMMDDPSDTDEFVQRLGELPRPLTLDILKTGEHPPPEGYAHTMNGAGGDEGGSGPDGSSMALADAINTQVKIALAQKDEEVQKAMIRQAEELTGEEGGGGTREQLRAEVGLLRRKLAAAKAGEGIGGDTGNTIARIKAQHAEELHDALQRQEEEYQKALANALQSKQEDSMHRLEGAYTQALTTAMDQKDADYTQKLAAVLRAAEADTHQQLAAQQATFARVRKLAMVAELGDGHGAVEAMRRAATDESRADMNAQVAAETLQISNQHAKEMEHALTTQEDKHSQHLAEVAEAHQLQHELQLRAALDARDGEAAARYATLKAGYDMAWRRMIGQILSDGLLSPAAAAILENDLQLIPLEQHGRHDGSRHLEVADAVLRALQEAHITHVGGASAAVAAKEEMMAKKVQTLEARLTEELSKRDNQHARKLIDASNSGIEQVYATVEKAYAEEMEALVRQHQELEALSAAKLEAALKNQADEFQEYGRISEHEHQKALLDATKGRAGESGGGRSGKGGSRTNGHAVHHNDAHFEDGMPTSSMRAGDFRRGQYPDDDNYSDSAASAPAMISAVLPVAPASAMPLVPFPDKKFDRRKKWGGVHYQVIFFQKQLGLVFEVDRKYDNLLCVSRNAFVRSSRYAMCVAAGTVPCGVVWCGLAWRGVAWGGVGWGVYKGVVCRLCLCLSVRIHSLLTWLNTSSLLQRGASETAGSQQPDRADRSRRRRYRGVCEWPGHYPCHERATDD
jgi:hypothetical protein